MCHYWRRFNIDFISLCRATVLALAVLISGGVSYAELPDTFPATLPLADLHGDSGFRLEGSHKWGKSGFSVASAGDVNGDGVDDLIVGAPSVSSNGFLSGQSYVVFGAAGLTADLTLSELDGDNGFTINGGKKGDESGFAVSGAGDINGDGLSDLLVGAFGADAGAWNNGLSYVVFGAVQWRAELELSTLNGANGFAIKGTGHWHLSGFSVSGAGDVNGDGLDDILIGAPGARPNGLGSGQSYVVFGSAATGESLLDLADLDGSNGFAVNGVDAWDKSGFSVSSAGDINNDGFDDIVVGAIFADPGVTQTGQSYVVFGAEEWSAALELSDLNGSNGFAVNGLTQGDLHGYSVSGAGDINGDGVDDLLVSAKGADASGKRSGESYVVFGHSGDWSGVLDVASLDGSNGFTIDGVGSGDLSGFSVSSAGDVNNDDIGDIVIGAIGAESDGSDTGRAYVVFGHDSGFPSRVALSGLDGDNGFSVKGIASGDLTGFSVSGAGDINHDGVDDFIVGAVGTDAGGTSSGRAYVVFGRGATLISNIDFADNRLRECVNFDAFLQFATFADELTSLSCNAVQDCQAGCTTHPDGTQSCTLCPGLSCQGAIRVNEDGSIESAGICDTYQGVTGLSGVEEFTNLQTLRLRNNDLTDISPLIGLSELQVLDLSGPDSVDIPCEQQASLAEILPNAAITLPAVCPQ